MGCNHCIDPSCLNGCPVEAYTKDSFTGVVLHSADMCIGCQYCTWNCQYGVPQYNEERGTVGKCDMCHNRLEQGRAPACVDACPENAIRIEVVNIAVWMNEVALNGNAPGMPLADKTVSTTRITQLASMPEMRKADGNDVRPEHPHLPLIVMTVLTQLSVGTFAALWLTGSQSKVTAVIAFVIAAIALGASTLHLGRPIHAYRALKMWRRSWLSREVVAFTLFAGAANAFAATLWLDLPIAALIGAATT
ncbi:MAG: DmsC/YnfH family molybdoenzyme membrane anchor subunit, partial [Bryobacteraceae bacterium]